MRASCRARQRLVLDLRTDFREPQRARRQQSGVFHGRGNPGRCPHAMAAWPPIRSYRPALCHYRDSDLRFDKRNSSKLMAGALDHAAGDLGVGLWRLCDAALCGFGSARKRLCRRQLCNNGWWFAVDLWHWRRPRTVDRLRFDGVFRNGWPVCVHHVRSWGIGVIHDPPGDYSRSPSRARSHRFRGRATHRTSPMLYELDPRSEAESE